MHLVNPKSFVTCEYGIKPPPNSGLLRAPYPRPPSSCSATIHSRLVRLRRNIQEERKTRTAYKDQMKREAFDLVNHIAANCDLHETVVVRSKELFAGWRNVK